MGEVHIVPSGKVYRQIFDAEVQLVRSLDAARRRSIQYGIPLDSGKIPLVKNLDPLSRGMLSHRQQMWIEGMPNDGITENPVFYRETKISAIEKNKETDEEIAAREVGSLTDIIVSEKTGSDIIQRVSQRRQKLHLEELMKLQKELADLSRDLEPLYLEGGETLLKKLLTSDEKVQQLFKKIESDSDLVTFTIQDLWKLWDDVIQQSLQRKEWIIELDEALKKLEWKRTKMVKDILKTYTLSLEKISFLVPCDVHRYIDKQAMMINQAFLANKRAVAKLYINLIEANLKWEKSLRLKWEDRVQDWKTIQRESFVQKLNGLKPPTCSKKEVHEWWSSFQHLNEEIDSMHVKHMKQFRMLYENICLECLAEIDKLREELLFSQVCTLDEVNYLVNHKLLPLAGNLQRGIEEELDHMDINCHLPMSNPWRSWQSEQSCKVNFSISSCKEQLTCGKSMKLASLIREVFFR
uniref:DUF4455 domain-containing protein n=1 Tax=Latimeria chalumnae TaxID=7897 RepID=H3B089_LATCH